jgi:hypothetical protein
MAATTLPCSTGSTILILPKMAVALADNEYTSDLSVDCILDSIT